MQNLIYTVEIQAGNTEGTIWQAMHPAETVTTFNGDSAEQIARSVAGNMDIAEGNNWRICVWDGADADTGTEPAAVLSAEDVHAAPMISYIETYHPNTDGLADLALPLDLEERLRAAIAEPGSTVAEQIAQAVNAKLTEHGVDTETGEWLGHWSAEEAVRRILDGQPEYTG